ncbi:hypothetical protein EJV47_21675 [Hymenobacter gummosus]|uniref:DUF1735 domain-containing protein n=1 Tax=Hymenobacter gummosus TaxID=1776032 RepID=A0A3S0QFG2_9BACT|nr:hypothetical protein [Hymenobacter gummosus]RTQ46562.1 hypothetical protein EJV47_21675 [Hymenobacter gummosus]
MKILLNPQPRLLRWSPLLAAGLLTLGACEKEIEKPYQVQDDGGFATIGAAPSGLQTKYAPGETVRLVVGYNAADQVRDVTVFQVVNRQDSAVVSTTPAGGTIGTSGLTELVIPYVVPANLANKIPVRVDVTTTFQNGATRLRRFAYNVAAAPTLRLGTTASPTTITNFRNNLAATAQAEGDIIGYNLVINEGGIGAIPTTPSTATLFKNVDSLTTFYRIGAGAPVRAGVVLNPSTGAANARTVDVRVPAGAQGQNVTYSFTAYAGPYTASVTAAPVSIVAPAALTRLRTGRITAGAGSPQDSAAYDLRLGANVLNSAAATTKDAYAFVATTSTGANTLGMRAENTTLYYRVPAATVATGYFANASANAVGTLLYTNAASLTANPGPVAPNDVFAVRVRGAEPMLLRVIGVRPSASGSTGRITFEYKAL